MKSSGTVRNIFWKTHHTNSHVQTFSLIKYTHTHTHTQAQRWKVSTISSLYEPRCHWLIFRQFSSSHWLIHGGKLFSVTRAFFSLSFSTPRLFSLLQYLTFFSPSPWFYLPVYSQNKIRKWAWVCVRACVCVCVCVCVCDCVCTYMSHLWLLWIYKFK